MCGILGAFGERLPVEAGPWADAASDRLRHRGPDASGRYDSPDRSATLRFRRLAILDLSEAGNQPMPNEDETVWLVFNGEIYNHRELRRGLERSGHRFRSEADSEVLVHLWEEKGPDLVHDLNGMFAFAIWDERERTGFLARDHVGIKPLYLGREGGSLWFASEAKALVSVPGYRARLDATALVQFLAFLWVPDPRTMFGGIEKLPPGHRLVWKDGVERIDRWWDWDQTPGPERDGESWAEELRTVLGDAVERQLQSDVPLGAFLSGGLDSSSVVAAMRERRPEDTIRCYTMASAGGDGFPDDLPYARRVADHLGLDLEEHEVRPDLVSLWPELVWQTDEPLADPAVINTYLIARHARDLGTIVLLSGQGGDELFHGYRSHRVMRWGARADRIPALVPRTTASGLEWMARTMGVTAWPAVRRAQKVLDALRVRGSRRALALADWSSPDDRRGVLDPTLLEDVCDRGGPFDDYLDLYERSRGATDVDRWSYVLLNTFLPALNLTYGDKAGMAASVEVRVPLLDREIVELAGRVPAKWKHRAGEAKWILGEAADPWLPGGIRGRPKTGFGAPIRSWLDEGPLLDEVRRVLQSDRFLDRGWFRGAGVRGLLEDLERGRRDVAYPTWAIFTLEHWARRFLDGEPAGCAGAPEIPAGAGR